LSKTVVSTLVLALALVGVICGFVELVRSKGQLLTAWGLVAVAAAVALLVARL
jgi:hypothetical protein